MHVLPSFTSRLCYVSVAGLYTAPAHTWSAWRDLTPLEERREREGDGKQDCHRMLKLPKSDPQKSLDWS